MAHKVLLITTVGWTSTARYAGGFAAAGWSVDALCPSGAPVIDSRYVAACFTYWPLLALASLSRAIARSAPDLVVPCDDRAVSLLLRLYAKALAKKGGENSHTARLIRRSLGAPEKYDAMISRSQSMAIAQQIGIRTPDTIAVASEAELDSCLETLGLPAVLKVDGSWGGDGVVVARTREEAHAAFQRLIRPASRLRNLARALRRRDAHYLMAALAPAPQHVSVQKFVAGRSAASAFACWNGEVVGAIYYDVLVAQGMVGPPNVIRRVDCPQMADASRKVARAFKLSGIFGLDFIRDAAGDVHLIEINPRTTQGGTLAFGEGRDLPSALAACISHGETTRREAIASDIVVFFPREWQRDPTSPYLQIGHHDVPFDDPAILKACVAALPPGTLSVPAGAHVVRLPVPDRTDTKRATLWRRVAAKR